MDQPHDTTTDPTASEAGDTAGIAERVGAAAESSREAVGATIGEVRERLPELMDAGGRTLEQVADNAPAAIAASMDMIDRSSTIQLALAAGACAGVFVGLTLSWLPRTVALAVGGMALVLGGALLGRRRELLPPWE